MMASANTGSRGRSPHRRCRPDGAGFVFGLWFYKDVAPTALKIVGDDVRSL
ncbi:MAG: hypothetical protein ACREFE_12120 [Limisphaerales bacterium]